MRCDGGMDPDDAADASLSRLLQQTAAGEREPLVAEAVARRIVDSSPGRTRVVVWLTTQLARLLHVRAWHAAYSDEAGRIIRVGPPLCHPAGSLRAGGTLLHEPTWQLALSRLRHLAGSAGHLVAARLWWGHPSHYRRRRDSLSLPGRWYVGQRGMRGG